MAQSEWIKSLTRLLYKTSNAINSVNAQFGPFYKQSTHINTVINGPGVDVRAHIPSTSTHVNLNWSTTSRPLLSRANVLSACVLVSHFLLEARRCMWKKLG